MFENPQDRKKIKSIFENLSRDEKELTPMFKKIAQEGGPIALYVATKDNSDITWMFDKDDISEMLGGRDTLDSVTDQLLPTEKDKEEGIIFVIFKKIGPLYSVRLERAILQETFA